MSAAKIVHFKLLCGTVPVSQVLNFSRVTVLMQYCLYLSSLLYIGILVENSKIKILILFRSSHRSKNYMDYGSIL